MDLEAAGLNVQPFPTHGKPLAVLSYASERDAVEVLKSTRAHPRGLALIQGPALSGKSTTIRSYVESLPQDCSRAVVDGKGLNTTNLLMAILRQFGYEVELSSANELLGLLRVFVLQQASTQEPPLLIVESVHELNPSALRALCELAELRVQAGSALKIVLVSDRPLAPITSTESMEAIGKRVLHDFHMHPMTQTESRHYLHAKLKAAGSKRPEDIFPIEICAELFEASGGWPGILDRVALLALARADTLPVSVEEIERPCLPRPTWERNDSGVQATDADRPSQPPLLVVTNNGSVMQEVTLTATRLLIGRADHNDITIGSRFVSRHHALLVRHHAATFLMDLNSTNGTYVNAKRISNQLLKHEDVVTLGHHKIKFYDPYATSDGELDDAEFTDTIIMKTLEDMRKLLARENTAMMPAASENLPTVRT